MKLQPLADRVIVKALEAEERTKTFPDPNSPIKFIVVPGEVAPLK